MNLKVWQNKYLIFILFILLSFVLYGNGINGEFVLDDPSIVQNPLVRDGEIGKIFVTPYYYARPQSGLYRPLTLTTFTINEHFSTKPLGFHLINIVLHGLVSFLIFILVVSLKNRTTAFISALLFMFMPIHVENVTSIVGRSEILALLFCLCALLAVLKNKYWQSTIFFGLAIFSKEVSIAFLPIWAYIELTYRKEGVVRILKKSLFFVPTIATYAFLRYIALGHDYFINAGGPSYFNPIRNIEFIPGTLTALKVLFLYVQKIVFPTYFSSDYSYNQIPVVYNLAGSWQAWLGILFVLALIYFSFRFKHSLIGLGAVIFLSSYFVISNLVFKIGTIMAERLVYSASFGFALMAGEVISNASKPLKTRKIILFGFILLMAVYGFKIIKGNRIWQNEDALFENAYQHAPASTVNVTNKASLLSRLNQQQEALEKIKEALAIEPKNGPALQLKGQIQISIGKPAEAEQSWKDAIDVQPDYLYSYISLGFFYYKDGNFVKSISILKNAPVKQPLPSIEAILALDKIGLGKNKEVISSIEESFGKIPKEEELQFILGIAYLKDGNESYAWKLLSSFKNSSTTKEDYLNNIRKTKTF